MTRLRRKTRAKSGLRPKLKSEMKVPVWNSGAASTVHLRYCLMTANMGGENRHAQIVMRELGIAYQHATPQSMYDSWWFWNCQNVPDKLPEYLKELIVKPHDAIGYGLDKQTADALSAGRADGKDAG